ncbi:MAG: xanthine dehydrogenase accessory protein XdhC [Rhizobiaceae bacterium]
MLDRIEAFFNANPSCVLVTIKTAKGSTPRARGAWMLVSETQSFETIGGGQMEYLAIEHARSMIEKAAPSLLELPLGPELGQCCGGFVELKFELLNNASRDEFLQDLKQQQQQYPTVYVFGAGHVGNALCQALLLLPLHIIMIDSRLAQLQQLPRESGRCEHRHLAMPESVIGSAPPNSAFVILTHDHAQDFLIAETALNRVDADFVGMIGSVTKLEIFKRQFVENGNDPALLEGFTCPIGSGGSGDKRPQIIASLVVAQLVSIIF